MKPLEPIKRRSLRAPYLQLLGRAKRPQQWAPKCAQAGWSSRSDFVLTMT